MERYTGDTALKMRAAGERYTTTYTTTDPWWGENKHIEYWVRYNGKVYKETTDRDGWLVLTEAKGEE